MIRRLILLPCSFVAGLLLLPTSASAQGGTLFSIQDSGLYQGLSGTPYNGFGGGVGAEGQIRLNLTKGRSVGAGVQFSQHGYDALVHEGPLTLFGVFVEPRVLVSRNMPNRAPYLSLRLALLNQSTKVGSGSVSATGFQVNGGGGILFAVARRIDIDVGATVGAVRFGTYSTTGADAGSAFNFVLRVGASIALGQ